MPDLPPLDVRAAVARRLRLIRDRRGLSRYQVVARCPHPRSRRQLRRYEAGETTRMDLLTLSDFGHPLKVPPSAFLAPGTAYALSGPVPNGEDLVEALRYHLRDLRLEKDLGAWLATRRAGIDKAWLPRVELGRVEQIDLVKVERLLRFSYDTALVPFLRGVEALAYEPKDYATRFHTPLHNEDAHDEPDEEDPLD